MTRLVDLLPHNAAAFERNAVDVVDSRHLLRGLSKRIISARYGETVDPALLPWLLRDWGLDEVAAYVEDWQLLYREGKTWQRERGTLAAVDRALSWIGEAGAEVEEIMPGSPRWAELQVALRKPPERLDALRNAVGLTRLSIGAKSILSRVHSGFDARAARPDYAVLDSTLLDFDSGVRLAPGQPVLSFGREEDTSADFRDTRAVLTFEMDRRDVSFARYVDDIMFDWSIPDTQRPSVFRPFDTGFVDNFSLESGARRDQFLDTHRIIRAAMILDRQWPVESLNAVFPGCDLVPTGKPWLADGFRLDADTFYFRKVAIEAIVEAVSRGSVNLRGTMRLVESFPVLASRVNLRVRRGFELDDVSLDQSASFPTPELQTFSHVVGATTHEVASEDLAFAPHATFLAGIRFDYGAPVESLQAVFTGADVAPTGIPWIADGFRLDTDTRWNRGTPILEILARREAANVIEFPAPTARAVSRVSFGGGALIESRIVDGAATLLTSFEVGTAAYDGQSWVDLVPPEGATWEDLHVIIGTALNGDPD
ncbi:hypothetical protein PMNALOAF_2760 [Methylobacterium adhaesivum]|uniref:Phage tail protein n=1 Tax=Methylobacterium adhaesivum TaxID=333297 RepID=A0ABT8BIX3_9HYPH|nr:phage tail protein [Methylobacterium adhaesivum]MDN3592113.1 phage tail protein [Methylobacterium adhaesivum]GJD31501.1 hypothetical protein PMNALOAF_2760 [Methylobacterium adhaesivum]